MCGMGARVNPRLPVFPGCCRPRIRSDSQKFAAIRRARNRPPAQQRRGFSQDSQDSQWVPWGGTISGRPGIGPDDAAGRQAATVWGQLWGQVNDAAERESLSDNNLRATL